MNATTRRNSRIVTTAALVVALIGVRSYAGGWNDGSRLASVESLVDRHTFSIDDSVFAQTQDKILVGGRFYSDKPPVPALVLAAVYQLLQWTTGLRAREELERFCIWMNFVGAGVPYVVAVWAMGAIATQMLAPRCAMLVTASFALATVAPAYARHVNSHIELLAVAAVTYLQLLRMEDRHDTRSLVVLGALAGIAYTLDLAAGPLFLLCTLLLVGARPGGWRSVARVLAAAAPAVLLHHLVTYAIAGTLLPANMVPAYFQWPGSPFEVTTMTGVWHHTPLSLVSYALALLFGKRGFLTHNLPLLILIPAAVALMRLPVRERPVAVHAVCWSVATWLMYALSSNNYSGACLSIRWFVPLLAPGYVLIALLLRAQPQWRAGFALLSIWGILLAGTMWQHGPWIGHHVPFLWPVVGGALLSWALMLRYRPPLCLPRRAGEM